MSNETPPEDAEGKVAPDYVEEKGNDRETPLPSPPDGVDDGDD